VQDSGSIKDSSEDKPAQRLALPAAGENKVRKQKTAKVQNQLKKRAESQPSGARCVSLPSFPKVQLNPQLKCLES
jgi:hypothetical protein